MISNRAIGASLLISSLVWINLPARAEESPMPQPASAEQIAEWIRQLDAELFAERSEASRQLHSAGRAAFDALTEAAAGNSREARMRALEILRQHFEQGDATTQQAAKATLEKIAGGTHPAAAARAKEILTPQPDPAALALPVFPVPQIQIQLNAGAARQVQRVRIANGVKEIEAEDGQRKVKITEDPAQGISLEVTETKNGQAETQKFQAKNVEELKKNHPEAHQIYQKFSGPLGGLRIQARAAALPAGPRRAAVAKQTATRLLASSRQLLENSLKQLEQVRGDGAADEAQQLEKSIERLKAIAQQLKEEEDQLSQP